ncbi:MAG: killer suppression protein HigA [Cyanobacteria bacterium P01_G01_bin.54]
MEITFSNRKLQRLCEQQALAQKQLGQACARKLKARLADLMAAQTVQDLVVGRPHPLKGDRTGQFAVDLAGGKRLVFQPANQPIPRKEDGSLQWSEVTQVCIVFIGDYHD